MVEEVKSKVSPVGLCPVQMLLIEATQSAHCPAESPYNLIQISKPRCFLLALSQAMGKGMGLYMPHLFVSWYISRNEEPTKFKRS